MYNILLMWGCTRVCVFTKWIINKNLKKFTGNVGDKQTVYRSSKKKIAIVRLTNETFVYTHHQVIRHDGKWCWSYVKYNCTMGMDPVVTKVGMYPLSFSK